ncbi:anhydro-N-acetylmuramic acid kinase [Solilutibacter silvestris]|uniref:Anhydro-N-acetylmuramic acid kinase n=1 Tax=Solilutibacter silvestris TaxID=1645665 RepID=A0A2K1Q1H4_9GAMM|nr:anhydro-N-acetylmuramic acid kinase [Lysobacter silvestris]PNS08899.1 putative molecular chaperone distantly related to HSP70-fold metalloprotease [Lysobacter silvestris]
MTAADGLYIGLMSGTSVDAIDAALVRFTHKDGRLHADCLHALAQPWDEPLRKRLLVLGQGIDVSPIDEFGELDHAVGAAFAIAANRLIAEAGIERAQVTAIGSHGQTLRHRPYAKHPFTLQIGDPNLVVERTGITTIGDIRRRDMAAGGHGAPLLPALHAALLHDASEDRAVLNLGGIANITLLPASGDGVRGWDTGPANALMDIWCERHTGERYDRDGAMAAAGRVDPLLLDRLLDDPWFATPPPKSTGREHFHMRWLESRLRSGESPADVQATLAELSTRTVADALNSTLPNVQRVLVCGGGVHNPVLMAKLATQLPQATVESVGHHGIDPDHVEAIGFAWLARQTMLGLPGNLPSVTGARGPRVLGAVYPA